MFNKSALLLRKINLVFGVFLILYSCNKDVVISFTEKTIKKTDKSIVDITYPEASGTTSVSQRINFAIENFLANEINMSETTDKNLTLEEAIRAFDNEYESFKEDFSDSAQQWEASFEGEVNFDSKNLVCIAINSYLDTGGAHGNSHVTFLNFDKKTGKLLSQNDIIKDKEAFKKLAQPYFEDVTKPFLNDESVQNMFFGEAFQLPENIGFNEVGVILLYNVYDIASYAQGITEFTIPYTEAKPYLKLTLE
jgi:hypothetical protein